MLAAGLVPNHIIVLRASSEVVVRRALSRAKQAVARGEPPRKDDNPDALRRRLVEYERNSNATLAALRHYLRVAHVDGEGDRDAVGWAVAAAVNASVR